MPNGRAQGQEVHEQRLGRQDDRAGHQEEDRERRDREQRKAQRQAVGQRVLLVDEDGGVAADVHRHGRVDGAHVAQHVEVAVRERVAGGRSSKTTVSPRGAGGGVTTPAPPPGARAPRRPGPPRRGRAARARRPGWRLAEGGEVAVERLGDLTRLGDAGSILASAGTNVMRRRAGPRRSALSP
jgi:hypothetical protein